MSRRQPVPPQRSPTYSKYCRRRSLRILPAGRFRRSTVVRCGRPWRSRQEVTACSEPGIVRGAANFKLFTAFRNASLFGSYISEDYSSDELGLRGRCLADTALIINLRRALAGIGTFARFRATLIRLSTSG